MQAALEQREAGDAAAKAAKAADPFPEKWPVGRPKMQLMVVAPPEKRM